MRPPAPSYAGEGPLALWHVSEDSAISRFEPRRGSDGLSLIWAVDTRQLPLYWFPRDCPRGTFRADSDTTPPDRQAFLGNATRIHAIQQDWVEQFDRAELVAYRMPEEAFAPHPEVGGYWVSDAPVEPVGTHNLRDLRSLHAEAEIPLRIVPDLSALWQRVIRSSLEFSGMRLRNLGNA